MEDERRENGIDPRLLLLLASVFDAGPDATMELTVVVDGTVISGSVVSEQAWTQRQNDQVRIGSWAIAGILDSRAPTVAERTSADHGSPPAEGQHPYIHFLGPDLVSGGIRMPLQATRVDLRKVAAWSIGRIPGG